jgi:hypothetical protein
VLGGKALERLLQLAHHTGTGGRGEGSLQLVMLTSRDGPRQLQQPGRRMRAQHVDRAGGAAHQLLQRLEQRHVGLGRAVGVDALAARDEKRWG